MNIIPSVSIITATYNDLGNLIETADSINLNLFRNIEWIVIDGGSSDTTVDWLSNYKLDINLTWISEKDYGIYDAWNKGLNLAKGKWIIFLGAGDLLDKNWISHALCNAHLNPQIIYGDNILYKKPLGYYYGKKRGIEWGRAKTFIKYSMCLPHPGMLHRNDLFKNNKFNINYKIAGDWDFFLRSKIIFGIYLIDTNMSCVLMEGISSSYKKVTDSYKEYIQIIKKGIAERSLKEVCKWKCKVFLSKVPFIYIFFQKMRWMIIR